MIRYPAFDPPEYLDWKPDPKVVLEFRETLKKSPERQAIVETLSVHQLLSLYEGMLRNRLHDIALKRWVKLGVISKAWLGTGEEASTVGPVHALERGLNASEQSTDFVAPMIRNAGACHEMGMPISDMLKGYLGTADSPTGGRDLHIGDFKRGVLAPISHVGDVMAASLGVALSFKLRREPRVVLTWIGDGSTKTGIFHESMNLASVQRLPLIVIIQNNQVALGTRLDQHHRGNFEHWAAAYGIEGGSFDGNNVLDAFAATRRATDICRSGEGPVLLIANTFRMGGHATHDEREARSTFSSELFGYWGKRDPIGLYENYLTKLGMNLETGKSDKGAAALNSRILNSLEGKVIAEIDRDSEAALVSSRENMPRGETAALGVYAESLLIHSGGGRA